MWTYIRVKCEYWEHDSSRYRLAMSQQTLIESLIRQTDKNFSLIIVNSAMDPLYTRRLLSFDTVGVPWYLEGELDLEVPRRQINVSDDVYLVSNFIETMKRHDEKQNIQFEMKVGFVFQDLVSRRWTSEQEHVRAEQITHGDRITKEVPWQWILPAHQMNDDMQGIAGEKVIFQCNGWRPDLVDAIAKSRIVTGSALGCDLHPSRSSSIIKGYKHYQNRGKVRRDRFTHSESKRDDLFDHGGRRRGNRLRCRRRKAKKNVR